MKFVKSAAILSAIGIASFLTACSGNNPNYAQQQQSAAQYQQQQQAPAPAAYQPETPDPSLADNAQPMVAAQPVNPAAYQVTLSAGTCPVAPYALRDVLSGYYGIDIFNRPLNAAGFPVDPYGYCLTGAPVSMIFHGSPSAYYVGFYNRFYGRSYGYFAYRPGYFAPGVHVYVGVRPSVAHVVVVPNYHSTTVYATHTVTKQYVPPAGRAGSPTLVRPGSGVVNAPATTQNQPTLVRPGAPATQVRQATPAAPSVQRFNTQGNGSRQAAPPPAVRQSAPAPQRFNTGGNSSRPSSSGSRRH
ncbi:MAG TPA: hypothetical protein V6C81_13465 [Planktothrix sp.]